MGPVEEPRRALEVGDGHPVGIDIDQVSTHLDLRTLDLRRISFEAEKVAG